MTFDAAWQAPAIPTQRTNSPVERNLSHVTDIVEAFGAERGRRGYLFERRFPAAYSYLTTGRLVGISVGGSSACPTVSVYSCARAGLRPSMRLYRAVSSWRSTTALGSRYLVERADGTAAVLCAQTIGASGLRGEPDTVGLLTAITEFVGEFACAMGIDLAPHGGYRLEDERLAAAQAELFDWWRIKDADSCGLLEHPR